VSLVVNKLVRENDLRIFGHILVFVPGGYKYGDLALQDGGVSDETVKYSREFCGTST
jgi:hypothetical protein